jgi:hypothetical protein
MSQKGVLINRTTGESLAFLEGGTMVHSACSRRLALRQACYQWRLERDDNDSTSGQAHENALIVEEWTLRPQRLPHGGRHPARRRRGKPISAESTRRLGRTGVKQRRSTTDTSGPASLGRACGRLDETLDRDARVGRRQGRQPPVPTRRNRRELRGTRCCQYGDSSVNRGIQLRGIRATTLARRYPARPCLGSFAGTTG